MPSLTIDMIRENPWNVITYNLPPHPSPALIELAQLAAAYCRDSEQLLMMAARDGRYTPSGWQPNDAHPDAHEESEARSDMADRVLSDIRNRFERATG